MKLKFPTIKNAAAEHGTQYAIKVGNAEIVFATINGAISGDSDGVGIGASGFRADITY